MMRVFGNSMLAAAAVVAVSALAFAEEAIIEKRTDESGTEVAPPPRERVIQERTVTQGPPVVKKRAETVTTTREGDNDNDNDNDND